MNERTDSRSTSDTDDDDWPQYPKEAWYTYAYGTKTLRGLKSSYARISDWDDYRARLAYVGDVGPPEAHRLAAQSFKITKRGSEPNIPERPKYLRQQLAAEVLRRQQETGDDHAAGEQIAHAGLYQPLHDNEIRVLELLPALFEKPLYGRLHPLDMSFTLRSKPNQNITHNSLFGMSSRTGEPMCYTALSYVWGPADTSCSIRLGPLDLPITSNLDTCLRYLRHSEDSVMLWVDQVCINQGDTREREQQVLMMHSVYSRAANTVIWLGPEDDRGAFGSLNIIDGGTSLRGDFLSEEELEGLSKPFYEDPHMLQSLADLFCRSWFTRTWTIQELVLSQQPYLMTGSSTIAWSDFGNCMILRDLKVLDHATRQSDKHHSVVSGLDTADILWKLKMMHNTHNTKSSITTILEQSRYAAVTEPVDKVYAILGVCRHSITPNYSEPAQEVFRKVIIKIMREELADLGKKFADGRMMLLGFHTPFRILCSVDHNPGDTPGLPSWIPDWSRPRLTTSIGYTTHSAQFFKAGGPFVCPDLIRVLDDNRTLLIKAMVFDQLEQLSDVIQDADLDGSEPENNSSLLQCIEFATSNSGRSIPSNQAKFLPFCQTVVAGKDGTGMRACDDSYSEVLSLLCDKVSRQSPTFVDQIYTTRQKKGHFDLGHLKRRNPGRLFQGLRSAFKAAMLNRRLCWTQGGRLGLVPRFAEKGDVVVLIPGGPVSLVVRKHHSGNYTLIGECYMHGVMDGSVMQDAQESLAEIRIV